MGTLRDRLIALADDEYERIVILGPHAARDIALAAARMALEDAEGACMDKWIQPTDRILCGDTIDSCAAAVRTLRDGLADV